MSKVLYIGGYGRSGSTVLDAMLGNHSSIFGGGELEMLFKDIAADGTCTCGDSYSMCAIWGKVLLDLEQSVEGFEPLDIAGDLGRVESTLGRYRQPSTRGETARMYARVWSSLFASTFRHTGASIVVDSSKTSRSSSRRILSLARDARLDVYVIHLIRDPRAVLYSEWGRGNNDELERGARSAFHFGGVLRPLAGWLMANIAVSISSARAPSLPVLRVYYEDLVSRPDETLAAIGEFVEVDLRSLVDQIHAGDALSVGHGVRGNRMRRAGPIRLSLDTEWIEQMSPLGRRVSKVFSAFAKLYGFDTSAWPEMPALGTNEVASSE